MKLSIITVTYNSIATLTATIESVLYQAGAELEYILIDGASTDGTVDLIRAYAIKDPRIRWISEPDGGIADAFNKGLAMATGDWIGILNSDDCYSPGALMVVDNVVAQHPEAGVIHGDLLRLDEHGQPLFLLKPPDIDNTVWHQMPTNHPATFVSRAVYEQVGYFNKDLKIAMDYDLILRLYRFGAKFVYIDAVLAHMRYGGASDDRLWQGLREVWKISVRQGYPRYKASAWLLYRAVIGLIKNVLRQVGLNGLLTLHPRFRKSE